MVVQVYLEVPLVRQEAEAVLVKLEELEFQVQEVILLLVEVVVMELLLQ